MTANEPEPTDEHDDATGDVVTVRRAHRRTIWALITAATLILTLSSVNTWVERQLLDTDNWVSSSSALLDNDELRTEVATYLVNQLYGSVDVGGAVGERLPENLQGLSSPVASILRGPLVDAVEIVLRSQAVQELWREANETAHASAVALLEDDLGPNVSSAEGDVTLDLRGIVIQVGSELGLPSDVLEKIPEDAGTVTIVESDGLDAAQQAVSLVKILSVAFFVVVIALYGAAIYLASNWRREAIRSVGMAIAFSGFLLLVIVRIASDWVVDGAETESGRVVANAVLSVATDLLGRTGWTALFVGALIWLFAALTGETRMATQVQQVSAAGFRRQAAAMWAAVALLIMVAMAWGPASAPANWWGTLFVVVVVIAGVEAIRRTSLARQPEVIVE